MGRWQRVVPDGMDPAELPVSWRLLHEPEADDYVVIGSDRDDTLSVLVRVPYAAGEDGADLRRAVASLITVGIGLVVQRRIRQI